MVATAFPRHRVVDVQLLSGGLSNSNFKVQLDPRGDPIVLRIYDRDPAVCQKEVDVLRLVKETVPVPEVLHAEPTGLDGAGPFIVLRYVDGITFRQLKVSRDADAIGEAAYSIGRALAAIGQYRFPRPGWLCAGPEVGGQFVEGPDSIPRFLDSCLTSPNFAMRVDGGMRDQVRDFAWSWAPRLVSLDTERSLVHSDFNSPNLLVRCVEGAWTVVAVIDWEFAFSGSPLFDVGNFMRYERVHRPRIEPHFSRGFVECGGQLGEDWKRVARVIDLTSLCEILTREALPDAVVSEVLDLIQATIEDRDPK